MRKFKVGEAVTGWPVYTWDQLVDNAARLQAAGPAPMLMEQGQLGGPPLPPTRVMVRNDSGADAVLGSVLRLGDPLVLPADVDVVVNEQPVFKGLATTGDANQTIVLLKEIIPDGDTGMGIVLGASWAKINVTSEGNTAAAPAAGESLLRGGSSGPAKILWKESGTGDKWAHVLLGGGGGSTIAIGQLIEEVPANSLLEDDCIELETFDGEAFGFVMDDEEPPAKVKTWAFNSSLNSAVRGSVTHPLRVWGEMYSVERTEGEGEEEVTVTHQVLLILGHLDPLVGAHGFVLAPDNDKGQMLMHHDGDAATVAEGGPCGGEE